MQTPEPLRKGDKIGIVAPARKITEDEIAPALKIITDSGFEPVFDNKLFNSYNQFAGTDDQRAEYFQQMLDNPKIKAIFSARGGYGSVRIIDKLDFSKFSENPKWLAGYSDFTVFLNHVAKNLGINTLHSTMPVNFKENTKDALEKMFGILKGEKPEYKILNNNFSKKGKAKGRLFGGNLSVLYSLLGSNSFPETTGNILFLEDLDEYLYHIDRMMVALDRAGKFENLSGLIIGAMTEMNDNKVPFGKSAEEIIFEIVSKYNFPVVSGFSAGHIINNLPLTIGAEYLLEVGEKESILKQL